MDPQVYKKTHSRIRELNALTEEEEPLYTTMTGSLAECWRFYADSDEYGAAYIPGNRLLLLGPGGRVPAENLPSSIEYFKRTEPYDPTVIPGDIDTVYREVRPDGTVAFWRWVVRGSGDPSALPDGYCPIPNNFYLIDGKGIAVKDIAEIRAGFPNPTREFDVNIGVPESPQSDVLYIGAGNKLVHTKGTGNAIVAYDTAVPGTESVNTFGDTLSVPRLIFNSTGHVSGLSIDSIIIPNTAADTSNDGIVKIGTMATTIGASNDAGTTAPTLQKPYVFVSAADHVHNAKQLKFEGLPGNDVIYKMSETVGFDFYAQMNIGPVSNVNAPDSSLIYSSISQVCSWQADDGIFTPVYVEQTIQNKAINSNTYVNLANLSITKSGLYLVSVSGEIQITANEVSGNAVNVPYEFEGFVRIGGSTSVPRGMVVTGTYTLSVTKTFNVSTIVKVESGTAIIPVEVQIAPRQGQGHIFSVSKATMSAVMLK